MIVPCEILEQDIVKVLVNEDGTEDEMYGVVGMNTGRTLGIWYLNPTETVYKSACVYRLDEGELSPAPYESIMEHYPTGTTFMDLDMKPLGTNRFAFYSEIDMEDDDSDIHSFDGSSLDSSFVVSDTNEIEGLPIDHVEVDKEWEQWKPSTPGSQSFKAVIDNLSRHFVHYSST
jgi:hypothetical protein